MQRMPMERSLEPFYRSCPKVAHKVPTARRSGATIAVLAERRKAAHPPARIVVPGLRTSGVASGQHAENSWPKRRAPEGIQKGENPATK
ncbi:hypothetical protein MRX96_002430 [Rhipicephalus microplus]